MEIVYFTIAAIVLYVAADFILDRIEQRLGRRLQYRSLVFFGILLVLAVVVFGALNEYAPG